MPNQFLSPEGDIENYFVSEYWLIDQYIGDELWVWGYNSYGGNLGDATTITKNTPVTTFAGGTQWKQVSASRFNTAAIKTDGTLWTWGRGDSGELGNRSLSDSSTPITTFAGGTDWKQVTGGSGFNAAIKTDGTLWTWGFNQHIGIDDGINRSTPITTFVGGSDWKQVSGGWFHTLAVKTDGTLWTWGRNDEGELGIGEPPSYTISTPVTTFAGGTNWQDISYDLSTIGSGGDYTSVMAAIKTDGTLWTWGYGLFEHLGTNDTIDRSTPVTTFAGGTDWKHLSVGLFHTAAIKTDGTLWTWGSGNSGALGNFTVNSSLTPVTTFAGGTNWKQVSAGESITAAIKTDGTLWTWGDNFNGMLGTNDTTNRSTPVTTFAGGTNWKQVSCFENHTAAIKTDGTLWVWGLNNKAQLGTNDSIERNTPVTTFSGGSNWKQVSCNWFNTAAIKIDGTLWVWGENFEGILGTNDIINRSTPVTTFAGGTNWIRVECGYDHIAAIKTDGTLWSWGLNDQAQLGTNDIISRSTPVTTFAGGTDWKQVSLGYKTTISVKGNGELYVWGNSTPGGKLGNASTTIASTPVTTFAGGSNWVSSISIIESEDLYTLSAGSFYTTAIKTDGTLWTWGRNNYGTLGDIIFRGVRKTPGTTFAGGTNWKQVSAGGKHTSAVKTDGTLWTWGRGDNGVLGTNDTTNRSTPVTTFAGGTNWNQVNSSNTHTTAIKTDGTLWIWGNKSLIPIDNNSRSTPITTISGGTNWADTSTSEPEDLYTLSAGFSFVSAIKTDGTLWSWGNAFFGQIGNASNVTQEFPSTTFAGGTNWKQVSTSDSATAAIKTDGTLWTWGYEFSGQLGNANTSNGVSGRKSTPLTTFAGGTNWKQVSVSNFNTAAIKTDGTLWVWGSGSFGRLGTNDTTNRSTPVTTFTGGTNWKQVSVGGQHTAAIKTDGTLWVWGSQDSGCLGNGFIISNRFTPVTTFAGGTNWKQVSAGNNYTAAIKTDGTLWIWGGGIYGQLGNFTTPLRESTPVTTFAGGTNWKQVSAGFNHTTAVKTDGTLWTWGRNNYGKLGVNNTTNRSTPVTTFAGGTNWKQVGSGGSLTVALKDDGSNKELFIFGGPGNVLGIGFDNRIPNSIPQTDWKQVSAGGSHTVAIKTDGTLWTWGVNINGGLGTNDTTNRSTPVTTFTGGTNWKQVSAGGSHTAAVKTDGTLWTWGSNGFISPLLGTNDTAHRFTPVTTFAGGTNWKQVSAGSLHTAAIKTDGTLWTWGFGNSGRLGTNDITSRSTPVTTFTGGTNWKQVSVGDSHTVALKDDGVNKELFLFGLGTSGELGNALSINDTYIPNKVGNSSDWKQAAGGRLHSAAIKTDGTLWIWGYNGFSSDPGGVLGTGSIDSFSIFTPVTTLTGGTDWKSIQCGANHNIAIKTDGSLWTWGNSLYGQLGNGEELFKKIPVTTFAGGTNWADTATTEPEDLYTLSAGFNHRAAIKTDGTLWVWGSNLKGFSGINGKLGTNDGITRSTPSTTFAGGTNWKQISLGYNHSAGIKTDGTLWVWGNSDLGELGNASFNSSFTPITTFAGGSNWKQVSAGGKHTAAIKTDGTLWGWGDNTVGQLGTNGITITSTPVTTFAGGTNWKQVSSEGYHTAAVKTDGTLWIWGPQNSGKLGNNIFSSSIVSTPITTFAGGTNWKQVSTNDNNTAAIKTDGTLWIWGDSDILASNDAISRSTPITTFAGGTNWKQVSLGRFHAAAVKTNGTLWTWGNGYYGELGNNDRTLFSGMSTPVTTFAGGTNWKQVSAGGEITIALRDDGLNKELYVFGSNAELYELGLGTINSIQPSKVGNSTDWKQASGGYGVTSAVKIDGTLWTWGYNAFGELGNNSVEDYIYRFYTPITTFAGGNNWRQVSCGRNSVYAVKTGIIPDLPLS